MVVLKPVLRVWELPPSLAKLRQHLPSIRDLISPSPNEQEDEIVRYLSQGQSCGLFLDRGLGYDVMERDSRVVIPNGPSSPGGIMTDGTWVWCGTLPYYVARYHLRLPEPFLRYAEGRGWKIDPASFDVRELDCSAYDSVEEVAMA